MDRETVLHHLRAWADGVDPSTGSTLPPDHPGQRPDTLRVVFAALALLAAPAPAVASRATRIARRPADRATPAVPGRPTTMRRSRAGSTPARRSARWPRRLERTRGAINARLVRLGKIEPPPGLRLRGESAPYADAQALG